MTTSAPTITADDVRRILNLQPHPEGGAFAEIFRSDETLSTGLLPDRYDGPRSVSTAIYYLLTPGDMSALHRIRSDEIFHFYLGDPVEQMWLMPDGSHRMLTIGTDLIAGARPQVVVPRGVWQGARLRAGGRFALLGCTVAPGFDFADFEMGGRAGLIAQWPDAADMITELTYPEQE